ncbi:MAG: hypothetical protein ABUL73_02405 [Alphaproteobacteria bacterium]
MVGDKTYNLSALADRLFFEKRLLPLAHKIRRARDLHSLSADLAMAIESLDALEAVEVEMKNPKAPDDLAKIITQSALLNNAVVLYARATKTTSKKRGGYDLWSRFSEEEKVTHKELTDLRDEAIAHFGTGGSYRGEWQAELVILQSRGEETKPGVTTRRKTLDRDLVQRARKQIQMAHDHLRELAIKKLDKVTAELNKTLSKEPEFYKEVRQHPLNLDIFLASPDAGEKARSSMVRGFAKGCVRHA